MEHRPLPRQKEAIEAPLGPVLVVAGPGAGKTFCLIRRIGFLISTYRLEPSRIQACTFTNKAAEEIASRLASSLGERARKVHRGTIHALCARILRDHAGAAGVERSFGVADEEYQRIVLARLRAGRRAAELLPLFGRARLSGLQLAGRDEQLFQGYVAELRRRGMLDFDDLVWLTARLLKEKPAVAAEVAGQWDYVLVDEFQDVNQAQYGIIAGLAAPHRNLFAVGDDEQSIFSWAGADPRVLGRFRDEFGVKPIVLDRNHRCSRQIFGVARSLLNANPSLFDKDLSADRRSEFAVLAHRFGTDDEEADWVLADLLGDRERSSCSFGDYAILYRQHLIGDRFEAKLVAKGVPCRLARGRPLGEDEVIGVIAASLGLIRRPGDPQAVEQLANRVLPEEVMSVVRGTSGEAADFVEALRNHARSRQGEADSRLIWRFVFHVENLAALSGAHATLEPLIMDLLSQRVGRFTNRLENEHERLTDPAELPAATRLALKLASARRGRARIVIEPMDGLEIGVRGLLHAAGLRLLAYQDEVAAPLLDDVPLGRADGGPGGLAITVFKALQLVHSEGAGELFPRYVAFDLETSSFDVKTSEIVEIAAARVVDGVVTERFQQLVRPEQGITGEAREVHGITEEEVKSAPPFSAAWPEFRAFVGRDTLVAHNGQEFDMPVLKRMAGPLGGADDLVCFDSLLLARSLFRRGSSLERLAQRFSVPVARSHRALDDALTLTAVFGELMKLRRVRSRKAMLVGALDYLGLALALDSPNQDGEECQLLLNLAAVSTLGRYSDSLEFYEAERARRPRAPDVENLIDALGGRNRMERLRSERRPGERYPGAVTRLRLLMEGLENVPLMDAIDAFLERVSLSRSAGPDVAPDRVSLLTLHATKGLEFSRVYVVGVEEDQLPGIRLGEADPEHAMQEARRLLYVGMTRAMDRLVLTHADRRSGRRATESPFFAEMGLEVTSPAPGS